MCIDLVDPLNTMARYHQIRWNTGREKKKGNYLLGTHYFCLSFSDFTSMVIYLQIIAAMRDFVERL